MVRDTLMGYQESSLHPHTGGGDKGKHPSPRRTGGEESLKKIN